MPSFKTIQFIGKHVIGRKLITDADGIFDKVCANAIFKNAQWKM